LAAFAFRTLIQHWISESKIRRSASAVAAAYLIVSYMATLLIRDPLIVPLIIIQSLLPILAGVLYDLRYTPAFMVAAVGLYLLLVIGMLIPLPTHLILNNDARVLVFMNSLLLGTERVLNTYRVIQLVFAEQANESQSRLEMLRILEADLRLRNAQLEQAAKTSDEANLAKTQFLQHMSHELRSPLNTVIGLSEIMYEDLEAFPTEMVKEQANQIYKAGLHLLSVISDVLDIAKIESGTFQVYYEVVDPLVVISDLEAMIVGLNARWPGVTFKKDLPDTLPKILAEDRRIRQILINLLDNAFKYTRNGEVTLSARQETEGVVISVQDTGIGISKEHYSRIFEPFEQVAGQQAMGTGLGLAITRHLVLEHGGILTVESEPAHGSTFSVFLPRQDISFAVTGQGTVLIVDADRNLHNIILHHLTRAGYNPAACTAPDEARELLRDYPIEGVVLDLALPTTEIGWQFLQELVTKKVPVVVYATSGDQARVERLGARFLRKPSRPSALVDAVHSMLKSIPVQG
jgi:signal transduction histidine kinase